MKKKAEIESIWEHLLSEKWVFIIKIEKFERRNHKNVKQQKVLIIMAGCGWGEVTKPSFEVNGL